MATKKTEVIVIGAGPSGLAVAACLKRAGIAFEMIEKEGSVASSWRRHYERLHLHTTKFHSALPFHPFPSDFPLYIPRDLFIQYLESYSKKFEVHPHFHQEAKRVSFNPKEGWMIETQEGSYQAAFVIVATGFNSNPVLPEILHADKFLGTVLHSSNYLNPKAYAGKKVLVIGMGNSGAEIALDLLEGGAKPALSIRSPVHITPRDLFGIPVQDIAILSTWLLPESVIDFIFQRILKFLNGNLGQYGIRSPKEGVARRCREKSRIPVIDVGTLKEIRAGRIQVRPGIQEFFAKGLLFQDGQREEFDAVICATGYNPQLEKLFDKVGWKGLDMSAREEMEAKGLYLIGFDNVLTGFLRQISIRAQQVVSQIASARSS